MHMALHIGSHEDPPNLVLLGFPIIGHWDCQLCSYQVLYRNNSVQGARARQ